MHYEKFLDGSVKCIEDEIPFELPQGWEWCRLSVYTAIMNGDRGKNYPSKDKLSKDNSGIPFISASDINNGYVVKDNMLYMSNKQYELLSAGKLKLGDIVFCIRGSLGKCGRFMFDNGAIASSLVIVRGFVDEESYLEYLYQYLLSPIIFDEIKKYDNGSAQPNLAAKDFMKFFVPVPPLAEQHRIVSKINELLSFVDIIESDKTDLQTTIQLTKSKILDLAIRGKLVPQNPDDEPASVLLDRIRAEKEELIKQGKIKRDKKESVIFRGEDNSYYEKIGDTVTCIDEELPVELPDGWTWCCLSMIGQTNIGLTYSPADITPNGTMVLRSSNIVNCKLDFSDLVRVNTDIRENQYVENNDILICARNGSKALVGKCALIQDMAEKASFGAFMAIYRTICFEYVFYYLQTFYFREIFYDSNSTAINQLTQSMIKNARIPLPPFDEQKRITEYLRKCFDKIDNIEKSLS